MRVRPASLGLVLTAFLPLAANATMPVLTAPPNPQNLESCMKWAADQDDDALYMWGMRDAGGSSSEVAVLRLALSCFGEGKPDIVGFGSSVGFNDAYCKAHPKKEICANWVAQEMGRR